MSSTEIQIELKKLENPEIASHSQKFFKTGKGKYGEGDIFLGIRVPVLRQLVKKYRGMPLADVSLLLKSKFHEERLFAIFMLVQLFKNSDEEEQTLIYELYLNQTQFINNWDIVDGSAGHIVGAFLQDKDRSPLYRLVKSGNLWERRIAIISTSHFYQGT